MSDFKTADSKMQPAPPKPGGGFVHGNPVKNNPLAYGTPKLPPADGKRPQNSVPSTKAPKINFDKKQAKENKPAIAKAAKAKLEMMAKAKMPSMPQKGWH